MKIEVKIPAVGESVTSGVISSWNHRTGDAVRSGDILLTLDTERVIDANVGGNEARFINHSCEPNCEPIAFGEHMWIVAVRDVGPGEELAYDYAIELDGPHTPTRKRRFPCACEATRCRGSILKPKRQPLHPLVRRAIARYGPRG